MSAFDFAHSRDYGAARDSAIMDVAQRFRYVQVEDVADLCCQGRARVARARLLALHRRGRLQRFTLAPFEPFIYTPERRSQKARHGLTVLRAYRALRRNLPQGWRLVAYDPEYEMDAGDEKRVIADALVVLDNPMAGRRRVVFLEVNLDANRFEKAENYNQLFEARALRKTWWYRPDVEIVAAVATARPDHVRRRVKEENRHEGIIWVVGPVTDLAGLWRETFKAKAGERDV